MIAYLFAAIAIAAILGIAANLTIRAACPHLRDPHPGRHGVRHLRTYSRTHQPAHRRPRGRHERTVRQIGAAA